MPSMLNELWYFKKLRKMSANIFVLNGRSQADSLELCQRGHRETIVSCWGLKIQCISKQILPKTLVISNSLENLERNLLYHKLFPFTTVIQAKGSQFLCCHILIKLLLLYATLKTSKVLLLRQQSLAPHEVISSSPWVGAPAFDSNAE